LDCILDRQTVSLASGYPETVEGQQPNCDRASNAHSNAPGVGVHRSASELKFNGLSKFMRRAPEGPVVGELAAIVSLEGHRPALAKAGSERVEDAARRAGFLQNPAASDCLRQSYNLLNKLTNSWGMV
jgi:hypothetical protein